MECVWIEWKQKNKSLLKKLILFCTISSVECSSIPVTFLNYSEGKKWIDSLKTNQKHTHLLIQTYFGDMDLYHMVWLHSETPRTNYPVLKILKTGEKVQLVKLIYVYLLLLPLQISINLWKEFTRFLLSLFRILRPLSTSCGHCVWEVL